MTDNAPAHSSPLPQALIDERVREALREDLGDAGDITSLATIPPDQHAHAHIVARKAGVIAGINAASAAFALVDRDIDLTIHKGDGAVVNAGDKVLSVSGSARAILTAERTALNFLGWLSGIATATHALVEAVSGTDVAIACTRKTTPGLRQFEKFAVRCGGGRNHRFGLYDAVMIKDNHIAAVGDIESAIAAARAFVGHTVKIEVEADTLDQAHAAVNAGADIILLDNMTNEQLKSAVQAHRGKAVLEASGNVKLETVAAIAATGVDVISSGSITHSAPTLDLGLDFD